MNKTQELKYIQDMLYGRKPIDEDWLIENRFQYNTDWKQKVGCGIDFISVGKAPNHNTTCFYINRIDGTKTDISSKRHPSTAMQKFTNAARNAVRDDINLFRSNINYYVDACPLSGELLTPEITHIDHNKPEFSEIITDYLGGISENELNELVELVINKSTDNNSDTFFTNQEYADDFRQFHNERANLRAITKTENLKKTKKRYYIKPSINKHIIMKPTAYISNNTNPWIVSLVNKRCDVIGLEKIK